MILGSRLAEGGDPDTGIPLLERSVAEFERLSDDEGGRVAQGSLADALSQVAITEKELRAAEALIRETLELDRAAGDRYDEIAGMQILCQVQLKLGESANARSTALTAARIAREVGAHRMLAHLVLSLVDASSAAGRHEESLLLAAAVEPISSELGRPLTPRDHHRVDTARRMAANSLGETARASAVQRGSTITAEGLLDYLATLDTPTARPPRGE